MPNHGESGASMPAAKDEKKVTIRVDRRVGDSFRAAALAYTAEGVNLNEVGGRLIRRFVGATDAERRKLIDLPRPPKSPRAKTVGKVNS